MKKLVKKLLPIVLLLALASLSLMACAGEKYTIEFVTNGGTTVAAITAEEGEAITKPADPTKAGKVFGGWYKDAALSQKYTIPAKMPAENIKLYAKWAEITYKLTFNTNGGNTIAPFEGVAEATITYPANPTKAGKVFGGWFTDTSYSVAFNREKMPSVNTTVVAQWLAVENGTAYSLREGMVALDAPHYTITDNAGIKTYTTTDKKSEWSGIVSEGIFNAKHYNAIKLVMTATEGKKVMLKVEGGTNKETDFFGTGAEQTIYVKLADENMGDRVAKGVLFIMPGVAGADAAGVAVTVKEMAFVKLLEENAPNEAKGIILFDANGGSVVAAKTAAVGAAVTAPTAPTNTNRDFGGWYADEAAYTFGTMPAGVTVLKAKWTLVNEVTVTFNTNGGDAISPLAASSGDTVTMPIPTRTAHGFVGWFTDNTFATPFDNVITANVTAVAKWMAIDATQDASKKTIGLTAADWTGDTAKFTITEDGGLKVVCNQDKEEWSNIKHTMADSISGYGVVKVTFTATAGKEILIKLEGGNAAKEMRVTATGAAQTAYLFVAEENVATSGDANKKMDLIFFPMVQTSGAEGEITFTSIEVLKTVVAANV